MTEPGPPEQNELERQLGYYRKRVDEQAGKLLQSDYAISGLQHEILQKRQGFALLAQLQQQVAGIKDTNQVFTTAAEAINSELGMDRTVVLMPVERHVYRVVLALGFHDLAQRRIEPMRFTFPSAFEEGSGLLLVNKGSEITPLIEELQTALELPFFLCVPVAGEEGKAAIGLVLTGRTKEVRPLYPPFNQGDVETFRAIAGLISATVRNMQVAVLQEMDRLKTEFFANISHEFRTPITLTLGPLEGLLSGRFGAVAEDVRGQLEVMQRNQSRLLGLITQILDLAKMESGGMQIKAVRVRDLNALVRQIAAQFASMAEKRGIELRIVLDPAVDRAEIYLDPEKLDRVLFNLLSNAHKFTKKGFVETATSIVDGMLRIHVADSGIGIRADQLPHVFDRFRQADGSASREYAGTGLGLALVHEIAKLHGGNVIAESVYGEGSRFIVALPLGRAHIDPSCIVDELDVTDTLREAGRLGAVEIREGAADVDASVEKANAQAAATLDPRRATVLYVDDNRDLRDHVRGLLASSYNVFLGVNGQDGLVRARACRPDLILSDLMMPVMTGTAFCQAVREDPDLRVVPFVLLTAKASTESRVEGLEGGADDYLAKPFSSAELMARVRNLVTIRKQHQRIKRELGAAREIQRSLLPSELVAADVRVEALYRPSEDLSGDFYDVVPSGGFVYVYLADVMSHGTAAAQITYLLRETVRKELAKTVSPTLADLLQRVGARYAEYGLPYDVGIQLGRLEIATRKFELVRANAPPAMRVGSALQVLSAPAGPALTNKGPGDGTYEAVSVQLAAGEKVFLFTDGAYEFQQRDKAFGLKRLVALLGKHVDRSWRDEVWAALVEANGSVLFADDVTILRVG